MSLQDITDKILADAKKEADQIEAASKDALAKTTAEKDKEASGVLETVEAKGKEGRTKLTEQAQFKARLLLKNASLQAKQELIWEVFEGAGRKLIALEDDKFVKLMAGLMKASPKLPDCEVVTSSKRKDLISKAIKEAGLDYKISSETLSEHEDGFVLSSPKIEVSNTLVDLLDDKKEELEGEVAKVLF